MARSILPKFDVVHTHGHPHWIDIYRKPKYSKARYIHTVHQIYFKEDSQNESRWITENILNDRLFEYCKSCDVVISVSKWLQQELSKHEIDSIFIPNGVEFDKCDKANQIRFRNKYNIHDDFFLFVGNSSKLKRADMFLELSKLMPDKLFILCGLGFDSTFNRKNVISLGYLQHEDILDAIAACKVLIVPSTKETTSLVLLEGLACKKPVVATNSSGMKEVMKNHREYLFEEDDIGDLYDKALKAWDCVSPIDHFYAELKANYDMVNIVKKIDSLYEEFVQ
jgi:glycosyltransferase involved in cell wall biosynthesis